VLITEVFPCVSVARSFCDVFRVESDRLRVASAALREACALTQFALGRPTSAISGEPQHSCIPQEPVYLDQKVIWMPVSDVQTLDHSLSLSGPVSILVV
jgi:hypothetical protein